MYEIFADLHVHIGRSESNKPIKITAARSLNFANIAKECVERKGINVVGIIDCASPYVIEDIENFLKTGEAYNKFREFVIAQHGDISVIDNLELLPSAKNVIELYSNEEGYVESIDAEKLGIASMLLGGGRAKKEDSIDYGVGVIVHKKVGDFVKKDEKLATIHANDLAKFDDVKATILNAYKFSKEEVGKPTLIYDIIKTTK